MLRFIVLAYPITGSENELLNSSSSLSIIAAEQYCSMKEFLPVDKVQIVLYSETERYMDDDILVVMTALPIVDINILSGFKKIVYFFDDLNPWKIEWDGYRGKIGFISAIAHPVETIADKLRDALSVPTLYVPWSLSRLPSAEPSKTSTCTIFLDIDGRQVYESSVKGGIELVRALTESEIKISVPSNVMKFLPDDVCSRVVPLPFLSHIEFLQFLGTQWYYASGIKGSYEFPVLEATFMGCDLISIFGAILSEHTRGRSVLNYTGQKDFSTRLESEQRKLDCSAIRAFASERYPRRGILRLVEIAGLIDAKTI